MQITLSEQAEQAVRSLMADGATADQVVEQAIAEKIAREAERAAIQEGIDDLRAGQLHNFEDVDREIRKQYGFSPAP